jgi:glycine cleavage system H protein
VDDQTRFTIDHIWVKLEEDNSAVVGITETPLRMIQDYNHIVFPEEGLEVSKDEVIATILEGNKTLFSVISPITGEVLAINEDIEDALDVLLEDNFEEGWLVRLSILLPEELEELLTKAEYEQYISEDDIDDDDYDEDDDYSAEDDEDDEDDYDDDDDDDDEEDYY